ncbi:hypothetical protein [Streptomyces sp. YU58]|nr:hypothetical protein [Streptomyces coralus]WLW58792.1 hypothetical protein QU709_20570 [Streptomyces coralus]
MLNAGLLHRPHIGQQLVGVGAGDGEQQAARDIAGGLLSSGIY